jgi:hypothetical protein
VPFIKLVAPFVETFGDHNIHATLFLLSDPEKFGMWMETCGETYLFGNKPVSSILKLKQYA